jgi:hypothetical protein
VITAHARKKRELRDELPQFFDDILLKISVASKLLIEADGEWAAAKAAEDPNALVAIVHRTHFIHSSWRHDSCHGQGQHAKSVQRPRTKTFLKHLRVKERI